MWAQNRYPGDDAKAEALANAMPYIWKTLNDLMGPEPVSDAGLANNGGDGALDIYLLHAPTKIVTPNPNTPNLLWNGYAASSDPADGCHAARYLVVDSNLPLRNPGFNGILDVAAHELMHAIQFAYKPCADQWLQESTATWAENFVYPQTNSEHSFGAGYLALLIRSIYTFDYGAYLFSYFHESAGKSADFMPLLWEVHKTKPALEAFHDVLPEGWDKAWPEFLAQTWNRPPVNTPDGYMMKDKLTAAPPLFLVKDVSVSTGIQDYPIELPKDFDPTLSPPAEVPGLAYLAGAYYHYKFKNNVRAVAFENSIADEAILHASVWGIEKIEGQWQDPVDYTKDFRKFWCRDQVDQDLEELVLIFGNSDWEKRKRLNPKKPSKVVAYAAGCTAWEGTVSFKMTMVTAQLGRLVETVTASMRLELDSAAIVPGQRHEYWEAVSGSIQWTMSLTDGPCSGSGAGSFPLTRMPYGEDDVVRLRVWRDRNELAYRQATGPWPDRYEPVLEYRCPGPPPTTLHPPLYASMVWFFPDGKIRYLAPDGTSFRDQLTTRPTPVHTSEYKWSFRMVP